MILRAKRNVDAANLLRSVVADPLFVLANADNRSERYVLWDWSRHLRNTFPLSCFRPSAYASLHEGHAPITHPLAAVIQSIVADERSERSSEDSISLHGARGLELVIDSRRCALSRDEIGGTFNNRVAEEDGEVRLIGSYGAGFRYLADGPVLSTYEPDSEYSVGGYVSPYEEIGVDLVRLVEAREAARPSSPERRGADAELKKFLKEIALQTRGRPTDLRKHATRRIVAESEQLVRLAVEAVSQPIEISRKTRRIFAGFEVAASETLTWALRLTLPVFSTIELLALRREVANRSRRGELSGLSTDFAVWLLAHRLRRRVAAVARKATNGWKAEMIGYTDSSCAICGVDHGR